MVSYLVSYDFPQRWAPLSSLVARQDSRCQVQVQEYAKVVANGVTLCQHVTLVCPLKINKHVQKEMFQKGEGLPACYQLAPTCATNWLTKDSVMCYHIYVIMHVKDPSYLS